MEILILLILIWVFWFCLKLWCLFIFALCLERCQQEFFAACPITCWFSGFSISSLLSRSWKGLSINGWGTEPRMLEWVLHSSINFPLAELLKMNLPPSVSQIRSRSRCQGWVWLIALSPGENNPHHPLRCFDSCPYWPHALLSFLHIFVSLIKRKGLPHGRLIRISVPPLISAAFGKRWFTLWLKPNGIWNLRSN